MAKGANQKLKLLYLIRIFQEKTDDDHGITMQEIINSLAAYGVTAERKSLYDDFETLGVYGIDINKTQHDRNVYYSIGSREFEVPELKLLVDAVQSSKFITQKKSENLSVNWRNSQACMRRSSSADRYMFTAALKP